MGIAHHKHGDAVPGKAGVDYTDSLACIAGFGDGLVEALLDVFFAGIHIVLSIVPAYIIRRASIKNF
jgi:hypothetical protein